MSMELWVLSVTRLNSIAEWQVAIAAEGYSLVLEIDASFGELNGFLPCHLRGELTGFECYHDDAAALMRLNADCNFGHDWKYALGLRWLGSKENETLAAWMAGTAYARATAGIVVNDQDNRNRTAAESAEVVREIESPSQAYEEARRELRRRGGLQQ
jgi:hypothetical protein